MFVVVVVVVLAFYPHETAFWVNKNEVKENYNAFVTAESHTHNTQKSVYQLFSLLPSLLLYDL